ncbi:MAG: hypothetical protein NXH90_15230 [Flavobacteriaceae bacterium]|nr:hypothetical protein [Flavobacteriaceae bacterium]
MANEYKIEEYKFAKEKIRKNEERRYQMIILSVTAFGVVFGFSDKIQEFIIPIALLTILIICATSYRGQTGRQLFTAAYVICVFEKDFNELNYETTLLNFDKYTLDKFSSKFIAFIKNYILLLFNRFSILLIVTFFSLIYYGSNFYEKNQNLIEAWELYLYVVINIVGYLYVAYNIYISRKKGIHHYIDKLNTMEIKCQTHHVQTVRRHIKE